MKATRCPICGLLTDPSEEYGPLLVSAVGNHEAKQNEEGFAQITETPVCPGSGMNGRVEIVDDHSLDHLIYDGMGYIDRKTGKVIGSVRPH
jgi:hypothetical protein